MFCTCFSELNKKLWLAQSFCKYHLFAFSVIKNFNSLVKLKKSMTITMIQFDKGGNNMRSSFALALYASVLKKKKLFVLLPKPGGSGTPYACNGPHGVAPPKRDTFFILQVYERVV